MVGLRDASFGGLGLVSLRSQSCLRGRAPLHWHVRSGGSGRGRGCGQGRAGQFRRGGGGIGCAAASEDPFCRACRGVLAVLVGLLLPRFLGGRLAFVFPAVVGAPVSALLSVRSMDAAAAVCVLGAAGLAPLALGAGLVSCAWARACAGCVWGVVGVRCSGLQRRGARAQPTAAGGVCGSGDRRLPPAHD